MSVVRKRGRRTASGALALLAAGVSGCGADAYDVTRNLSYDSTIGHQGTFDFYEPER